MSIFFIYMSILRLDQRWKRKRFSVENKNIQNCHIRLFLLGSSSWQWTHKSITLQLGSEMLRWAVIQYVLKRCSAVFHIYNFTIIFLPIHFARLKLRKDNKPPNFYPFSFLWVLRKGSWKAFFFNSTLGRVVQRWISKQMGGWRWKHCKQGREPCF